ncbi:MAG: hypothetical protein IJ001_07075 [Oscillospiraceae bacterium]|nr:hypothetical protein [Oscillospiraceae bacterium]
MDGMEEKLGSILNNPQMMQQIMAMAQSLGQSAPAAPPQEKRQEPSNPMPQIDPSMLQKLSGFANQSGIDSNERALLKALGPYLSRSKVTKLENAMRAAKMARFASAFLGSGGMQLLTGR